MGVYDELSRLGTDSPAPRASVKPKAEGESPAKRKKASVDQSIDQSTRRSIERSTNQSTDPLTDVDALGPIAERPHAFYITQKVDRWLDEAVRYLRERGLHKVDRSVLVNALLHDPGLYKPKALDKIRERLLAHLTNKSLKRAQSTG